MKNVLLIIVLLFSFSCSRAPKPKTGTNEMVAEQTETSKTEKNVNIILNAILATIVAGAAVSIVAN